jgi:hypothetical protein
MATRRMTCGRTYLDPLIGIAPRSVRSATASTTWICAAADDAQSLPYPVQDRAA